MLEQLIRWSNISEKNNKNWVSCVGVKLYINVTAVTGFYRMDFSSLIRILPQDKTYHIIASRNGYIIYRPVGLQIVDQFYW